MHLEPERHRSPSISLTPLIDVVFILLVFFMLASRFSHWKDLPVNVQTRDVPIQQNEDKDRLILTVIADGRVKWGNQALTQHDLKLQLADNHKPVVITGEPDAPLQATLATLDTVRAAGIEQVQLELMP